MVAGQSINKNRDVCSKVMSWEPTGITKLHASLSISIKKATSLTAQVHKDVSEAAFVIEFGWQVDNRSTNTKVAS